jgi:hypothetical protein
VGVPLTEEEKLLIQLVEQQKKQDQILEDMRWLIIESLHMVSATVKPIQAIMDATEPDEGDSADAARNAEQLRKKVRHLKNCTRDAMSASLGTAFTYFEGYPGILGSGDKYKDSPLGFDALTAISTTKCKEFMDTHVAEDGDLNVKLLDWATDHGNSEHIIIRKGYKERDRKRERKRTMN